MSTEITSVKHLEDFVANTPGVVMVDFWADWCGPCKMVEPILDELEAEGKAAIAKVDVDTQHELTAKYRIVSIPTMHIYRDGELVNKNVIGAHPKHVLEKLIAA